MNINKKTWLVYSLLAIVGIIAWYILSYPQLTFVDLTISRQQAIDIATDYVKTQEPNLDQFKKAVIFKRSRLTNRYLQKTIGYNQLDDFSDKYGLNLFFWQVRFFKEGDKETYSVTISSKSGEIIGYNHMLDELAQIEEIPKDVARENAIAFLGERYGFNVDKYMIKGDLSTIYDFRKDHTFAWQHRDVNIPWKREDGKPSGTGKLITSIKISGDQVLSFSDHAFRVPEDFSRHLELKSNVSQNLSVIVRIFSMIFFIASIYYVVSRRNHLAMHTTKKAYIIIAVVVFILAMFGFFNSFESIIYKYNSTADYNSYIVRFFINALMGTILGSFIILMPGLSGELLHFESFRKKPRGSLLHYVHSTFFSRDVAKSVFLGYLVFIVLLGIQSILLKLGQSYCGVWVEYAFMTTLTTAYIPFLASITLGFKASMSEEILYRLFGISFGKKFFKNTAIAVLFSSILFGFAHTTYPVYPMWFRAIEVSLLGIFISFVYLRYGFICVVVAHYVFDAFWHSSVYLFGNVHPFYFTGSIIVLALPMLYGLVALLLNRKVQERPMRWFLNKHQKYNLEILKTYLNNNKQLFEGKSAEYITEEISSHGWDFAVVDVAVEDFKKEIS